MRTERNTVKPLVPETSAFEFELPIAKLKSYKSPGIHQILAELRQGLEQIAVKSIHL
jgi:hypothetical protein